MEPTKTYVALAYPWWAWNAKPIWQAREMVLRLHFLQRVSEYYERVDPSWRGRYVHPQFHGIRSESQMRRVAKGESEMTLSVLMGIGGVIQHEVGVLVPPIADWISGMVREMSLQSQVRLLQTNRRIGQPAYEQAKAKPRIEKEEADVFARSVHGRPRPLEAVADSIARLTAWLNTLPAGAAVHVLRVAELLEPILLQCLAYKDE